MADAQVLWSPDPARIPESHVAAFIARLRRLGHSLPAASQPDAFPALHAWSVNHSDHFWRELWLHFGLGGEPGTVARDGDRMAPPVAGGARWFPEGRINYAQEMLRGDQDDEVVMVWDETGPRRRITRDQLRSEVARIATWLSSVNVGPGDRVAGWLPNIAETLIAMLAASSIGAVWTSCSPDFGVSGVVDRFGQTEPVVLLVADGYRYGGKVHDCTARLPELLEQLPSVRHAVLIRNIDDGREVSGATVHNWTDLAGAGAGDATQEYQLFPFDHPLWILYSSGTTGLPKCLVHGAGGSLLQHVKEHRLHCDLHNGERLFYFTTCGWMMWNWLVSGLASGAAVVLYDGSPMPPGNRELLWDMAAVERVNIFGTSAKYIALAEKSEFAPAEGRDLSALRAVLSTGSPLATESFDWIAAQLGNQVQLSSISGGTDIVSCFVLGNPLQPVRRGEIQGPGLGMAVEVYDHEGEPVEAGTSGELVCTRPFPSMPVGFWNDPDGGRYQAAYFATWPEVWHHGDWVRRTASGGYVISGRSDATLNPGGVRIGTAEIYRMVEVVPEVVESLVVGQRVGDDVRVVLFVVLRGGIALTEELITRLRRQIREGASPHHVPRVVLQVPDLPRTRSGKLSELAVRAVVEGREVQNVGALANPEALDHFRNRPELGDAVDPGR